DRGGFATGGSDSGSAKARDRVALALRDLGPGLGDVVLRCCCFLEGLEAAEKRMGWSARSGKIVLRIALQRLKRHYDETYGGKAPLIGGDRDEGRPGRRRGPVPDGVVFAPRKAYLEGRPGIAGRSEGMCRARYQDSRSAPP